MSGSRPLFRWSAVGWLPAATSLLRCLDPDRGRPARPYPPKACSLAGLGDRPEILGLEAGAADQRAVDFAVRQDLGGVLRVDRPSVEDPRAGGETGTDRRMHFGDIRRRPGQPGA